MIINCKCGKYQFDVKKSEIGTKGREVQCGICNEKWFYGTPTIKAKQEEKIKFEQVYKTPLEYKIIFLLVITTTIIGFLDLTKTFLIKIFPSFQDYYIAKEQIILKIISLF